MSDNGKIDAELLETPLYSYSEAEYLAGVTRGTARRWLAGYQYKSPTAGYVSRPPVTVKSERDESGISFIDLVEIVAIGGLKAFGFTLREIRSIVANTQEVLQVRRPLTTVAFKVGGRDAFVAEDGQLLSVLRGKRQRAWDEVLQPFLATLDYSDYFARRWWPLGKNKLIYLDPEYAFGLPVIAGSGVRTEIVFERWDADASREEIAEDFNLSVEDVDNALRFEVNRAMKRAA